MSYNWWANKNTSLIAIFIDSIENFSKKDFNNEEELMNFFIENYPNWIEIGWMKIDNFDNIDWKEIYTTN